MIGISTTTFDVNGSMLLMEAEEGTDVRQISRRVTRKATLDGNAEIEDMGLSHADRTFTIRARDLSKADYDKLALIVELYPLLVITTAEGAFEGAPDTIRNSNGVTVLRILINRKLS